MSTPSEPPPPYEASSSSNPRPAAAQNLEVPNARNGIPPHDRRSMEDEFRDLPSGWTRQYDEQSHHQFFVDTRANPPRSIWHHPFDDEQYINSLSSDERARLQSLHRVPTPADLNAESSDDDVTHPSSAHPALPPRNTNNGEKLSGAHKLGRRMKDKLTSSTHEEREVQRRRREEEERQAYQRHLHIRRQMSKAMETGQPQLLGKDRNGKDVYIEPPQMPMGYGGYQRGGYGYNPYNQGPFGPFGATGGQRYMRPAYPYSRPYGGGYGGGFGMPLIGGLAGGAVLGSLLF
ncbi:uncharacterized protein RSE6_01595 [Rhynchosporium secalis]|uniref:WW domain-containing protein n=2 Tax=Rhynchosporium TaxID=38037 RepID=A0A1E1LZU6_RHYSE|nr:uncharacterized protein RSE6_01595 [Rhynchosporium secalis]